MKFFLLEKEEKNPARCSSCAQNHTDACVGFSFFSSLFPFSFLCSCISLNRCISQTHDRDSSQRHGKGAASFYTLFLWATEGVVAAVFVVLVRNDGVDDERREPLGPCGAHCRRRRWLWIGCVCVWVWLPNVIVASGNTAVVVVDASTATLLVVARWRRRWRCRCSEW